MTDTTFASRHFAILRDLDSPDFRPLGVMFETEDGGAELRVFDDVERGSVLRRDYPDFDAALGTWQRSALISLVSKEAKAE